jgi:hypothetical protein
MEVWELNSYRGEKAFIKLLRFCIGRFCLINLPEIFKRFSFVEICNRKDRCEILIR